MKQRLLTLIALVGISAGAFALVLKAPAPGITFTKTSHDFGKIPQGKPVSYEFEFTNTGDQPLVLKAVKASCGCTTPYYPTEPVLPGEKGKIKAVYNAASPGSFHKSINVTTNIKQVDNATEKKVILFINGEVIADKLGGQQKDNSPVRLNNN